MRIRNNTTAALECKRRGYTTFVERMKERLSPSLSADKDFPDLWVLGGLRANLTLVDLGKVCRPTTRNSKENAYRKSRRVTRPP